MTSGAGAPYAGFDGIRIRDIKAGGSGVTIEAELAAAYPKVGALSAFTRTFAFDGSAGFTVSDRFTPQGADVDRMAPAVGHPVRNRGPGAYRNGAGAAIEVAITEPKTAEVAREVGKLKVPGPPGSITSGAEEDRGYVLTAKTKGPAGEARIDVSLKVVK